ncbi:UDP-glucose 4-epimerase GalE [Pontibacter sp. G13]|uniref:UDP-glucose 4-epimerase GalE n=1 Tax=Pontibacter sp. G13 TaxID=3074898 RepID=UPI00288B2ED3|nr:UDP-glucose 4-epimerase GalE [Pontibacter sp. G13]WNJ19275.1 UDP-glucose 4-epimerase GalE [Pontibacter sp. G13]
MPTVLITGGCGYIGSHTAIELMKVGKLDVISIDNHHNSSPEAIDRIEAIAGKRMKNYAIDACDRAAVQEVFEAHPDIVGVIHFAAYKAVGESVEKPLEYYHNNFESLVNMLAACEANGVENFIFSSSCTVYGDIDKLPVTEETPTTEAASPYGNTKLVGERIIQDFIKSTDKVKAIALRYFNPVGADESGLNGEDPINAPNNLVPFITRVASGLLPQLTVFGGDYPTRDGTCIRDYIHVTDISIAHINALDYLLDGKNSSNYERLNLGSGNGVSVLEAINAFEEVSGVKLNYVIGDRRPGDVTQIYSDSSLAKEKLGWVAGRGISEMMASAWKWQLNLNESRAAQEA